MSHEDKWAVDYNFNVRKVFDMERLAAWRISFHLDSPDERWVPDYLISLICDNETTTLKVANYLKENHGEMLQCPEYKKETVHLNNIRGAIKKLQEIESGHVMNLEKIQKEWTEKGVFEASHIFSGTKAVKDMVK